jgi:hypothetical protein
MSGRRAVARLEDRLGIADAGDGQHCSMKTVVVGEHDVSSPQTIGPKPDSQSRQVNLGRIQSKPGASSVK